MPDFVELIDVGPRDGLQNLDANVTPEVRADLVNRLLDAGVDLVEAVSFMSESRVPQMAGAPDVIAEVAARHRGRVTALVPNERGFQRAAETGLGQVRFVVAASDEMNRANFGVGTDRTVEGIEAIAGDAAAAGIEIGVIIGTAFGCPYEGAVPVDRVLSIVAAVAECGASEILLADTTGMAYPAQVGALCQSLVNMGVSRPGVHLHNTRNTGYANALRALDAGVRRFDASIGGLGGCPFAPGASGNVATEELAAMLIADGLEVNVDVPALMDTAQWLSAELERELPSQLLRAGLVTSTVRY